MYVEYEADGKTIKARVWQKVDTLANWEANTLVIGPGEQAFVVDSGGAPINFKIGDGTKRFSELPWWIDYAGGQYVQVAGNALPTPTVELGYTFVGPGTYTFAGQPDIVAPDGRFSQLVYEGGTWSLKDMGALPETTGTDEIQQELIPKGKAVTKYAPSKTKVGIVHLDANTNILSELTGSDINNNDLWEDGFLSKNGGGLTASSEYRRSKKYYDIFELQNFTYSFVLSGNAGVCFFDKNNVFVSAISNPNASATGADMIINGTYTAPAGAVKFKVSHHKASLTSHIGFRNVSDIEQVTSNVFLKTTDADAKIDSKTAQAKTEAIADTTTKLDSFGLKVIPALSNLYPILVSSDLNNSSIWSNGYIRIDGTITADPNWVHTDYLPIYPGTYQTNIYCAGNSAVVICDINKNVVQYFQNKGNTLGSAMWTFTVSESEYFIRVPKRRDFNFNTYVRPTTELKVNQILTESKSNSVTVSKDMDRKLIFKQNIIKPTMPILAIVMDDGDIRCDWALSVLDKYNYKAGCAIITNRLPDPTPGDENTDWLAQYYNIDQLITKIVNRGHDVYPHTRNHNINKQLATLTLDERRDEIIGSRLDLMAVDNRIKPSIFIPPFGSTSVDVERTIREGGMVASAVTRADADVATGAIINQPPIDNFFLKRFSIDNSAGESGLHKSRLAISKLFIDKLKEYGGLGIAAMHPQYDEYVDPSNTVDRQQEFEDWVDYVHAQGITVMTLTQAWDYYKNTSYGNYRLDAEFLEIGINGATRGNLL